MENEKRRSKFNIIDLIIIAAILAIAVFVGLKFFGGRSSSAKNGTVQYTVLVECVPQATYDSIKDNIKGQTIANGSYINCDIVDCVAEPCKVVSVEASGVNNEYSVATYEPTGEYVNLTFTLRAAIDLGSLLTEVGTQEVRPGRSHIIKTQGFEFTGLVLTAAREQTAYAVGG